MNIKSWLALPTLSVLFCDLGNWSERKGCRRLLVAVVQSSLALMQNFSITGAQQHTGSLITDPFRMRTEK